MTQLFAQTVEKLQNVYAPLPFNVHLVFCIFATVIYLVQFSRKKAPHYLAVLVAIDITFLTQFFTANGFIIGLFCAEVLLLLAAGILSHKFNAKQKALKAAAEEAEADDDTDGESE